MSDPFTLKRGFNIYHAADFHLTLVYHLQAGLVKTKRTRNLVALSSDWQISHGVAAGVRYDQAWPAGKVSLWPLRLFLACA